MSDRGDRSGSEERKSPDRNGRKDRSASKSKSHSPRARSYSKSRSHSRSRSYSHSKSRSHSPRRSRSGSHSRHSRSRKHSRSRSKSPYYKRRSSPYQRRRRHYGSRDDPPRSNCLGIFGLSLYTTERDLKDFLEKYGTVDSCQLVYDHQSGRSRGFAFAYFPDEDEAEKVKEETSGLELDGRRCRVDYSITQRAHTPTPGVYMGKPSQFRNRRDDHGGGRRDRSDRASDRGSDRDYDRRDRYDRDHYSRSRSRSPRRY